MNHRNESNKLVLANIYSDILRINAPNQPYEDDKIIKKIFKIIIEALDGVQNPNGDDYDYHFRVLDSLATVQSYIVLNDLEDEQLLMELTDQLFKITKEETIKLALRHITDIICGIIEDLEHIPKDFLQFIFLRLINPIRQQSPTEYDLATSIIRRCSKDLQESISEYITLVITFKDDEDEEDNKWAILKQDDFKDIDDGDDEKTKKKKLAKVRRIKKQRLGEYKKELGIIAELASICEDFLENAQITLEECLQTDNEPIRTLYVDMFASIFTQSSPSLSQEWSPLFRVFLKRYDDVSVEIREFMASITCDLFQKQYNFIPQIQNYCIRRCEDYNDKVRFQIVEKCCIASIQSISQNPETIISNKLQTKLLDRMLDKKQSVRYCAIENCAKLFGHHVRSFWRGNKALPPDMRCLLPIPKRLIGTLNAVDLPTKIHLEQIFDQEIIGNDKIIKSKNNQIIDMNQEIEERINVLLGIMALLIHDDNKKNRTKIFQKFFMTQKFQLQVLVNKIISTFDDLNIKKKAKNNIEIDDDEDIDVVNNKRERDRDRDEIGLRAVQKQYEVVYSNFNQRFAIYGSFRHISTSKSSSSSSQSAKSGKPQKQKPGDLLKELIENPNGKIRRNLQHLCEPDTTLKQMYNYSKNMISAIKASSSSNGRGKTKLENFAKSLCIRLSNVLFSCDTIPVLINKLIDMIENNNGQPRALLESGLFILNKLCDEIPKIFNHNDKCLKQLIQLFNLSKIHSKTIKSQISYISLRILAKSFKDISLKIYDDDDIIQQFILDLIDKSKTTSSHQEAQLATECLIHFKGQNSKSIKQLCKETSKELDITEERLPSLLASLSTIAKSAPNTFITRSSHIIDFILETLLPYDLDENDGIHENNILSDIDNNDDDDDDNDNDNAEKKKDSDQQQEDEEEDEEEDDDVEQGKKQRKSRKRSKKSSNTKNKNKNKNKAKNKKIIKQEESSMTPILLTSKQYGIKILVNYLLSIVERADDPLGAVELSPIKSPSRSPKRKRKRSNKSSIDINFDDVEMEDSDQQIIDNIDGDDDVDMEKDENNGIEMVKDADPYSQEPTNEPQEAVSPMAQCDRILNCLFAIIRKYGQIKPEDIASGNLETDYNIDIIKTPKKKTRKYSRTKMDKTKKEKKRGISREEEEIVNMAVDAITDIILHTRYRRQLGLLRFYELAFLIHHRNANIRTKTMKTFWNKLRDHKLPSHYSCLFPLVAVDPNKKLRDNYRPAIQKYYDRMRKENQIRSSSSSKNTMTNLQISKLPEYILFYLVHLLANHPDFDEKLAKKEMKNPPKKSKDRFASWRGRRTKKSDLTDSEYDTSPARMIKKKKKTSSDQEIDEKTENEEKKQSEPKKTKKDSDKQEADDDEDNNEDDENEGGENKDEGENKNENDDDKMDVDDGKKESVERVVVRERAKSPQETSCYEYFGAIFNYYFDTLIKGTRENKFPMLLQIIHKIDRSYDVFKPSSRAHRYLARIAFGCLKKKMTNQEFPDFDKDIPLPKALFRAKDDRLNDQNVNSSKITMSSPRRTDKNKSRKRKRSSRQRRGGDASLFMGANESLLRTDQSLLGTTTASDSNLTSKKRKKDLGLFSKENIQRNLEKNKDETEKKSEENQDNEDDVSEHPSDFGDEIMKDIQNPNISELNLETVKQSLNESLIDKGTTKKGEHEDKDKDKEEKENDKDKDKDEENDETNIEKSKRRTRKSKKNIGRKRTRVEMDDDDQDDDIQTSDQSDKTKTDKEDDDNQPPKKRPKRRGARRK